MMDEIKASVTAALVGLTFPCARDVGIGTLCAARWAMNKLHKDGNVWGQRICAALILLTAEELRERYLNERRLRIEYDFLKSSPYTSRMRRAFQFAFLLIAKKLLTLHTKILYQ